MSISLFADSSDSIIFTSLDNEQIDTKIVLFEPCNKLDLLICIEYKIILKEEELETYKIFVEEDGASPEYTKKIEEINKEIDELQSKIKTLD